MEHLTPGAHKILSQLAKLNGASIGSITTETVPVLKGGKKNPMKDRVIKRSENSNVMFFCNNKSNAYNNMVKRRLLKEGKNPESFVLSKRVWGERIQGTPFVFHKGHLYLEVIFLKAPKTTKYIYQGEEITKEDVIGLDTSRDEAEQGGLEDKVVIRTFKLSSIKKIKMGDMSVDLE